MGRQRINQGVWSSHGDRRAASSKSSQGLKPDWPARTLPSRSTATACSIVGRIVTIIQIQRKRVRQGSATRSQEPSMPEPGGLPTAKPHQLPRKKRICPAKNKRPEPPGSGFDWVGLYPSPDLLSFHGIQHFSDFGGEGPISANFEENSRLRSRCRGEQSRRRVALKQTGPSSFGALALAFTSASAWLRRRQ